MEILWTLQLMSTGSPGEVAQVMRRLGSDMADLTSLSLSDNVALGNQGAPSLVEGLCELGARL